MLRKFLARGLLFRHRRTGRKEKPIEDCVVEKGQEFDGLKEERQELEPNVEERPKERTETVPTSEERRRFTLYARWLI